MFIYDKWPEGKELPQPGRVFESVNMSLEGYAVDLEKPGIVLAEDLTIVYYDGEYRVAYGSFGPGHEAVFMEFIKLLELRQISRATYVEASKIPNDNKLFVVVDGEIIAHRDEHVNIIGGVVVRAV